jgi:hypothetical protein
MAEHSMNLADFLVGESELEGEVAFRDDYFSRVNRKIVVDADIRGEILTDTLAEAGVCCHYVSLDFLKEKSLELTFRGAEVISNDNGLFVTDDSRKLLLWLPVAPVVRIYDAQNRITSEKELPFGRITGTDGPSLQIRGVEKRRIEFHAFVFTRDYHWLSKQFELTYPVEARRLVFNTWFRYEGIGSVWNHIVNGRLYHPMEPGRGPRWQCQLCANTLYNQMAFQAEKTHKDIYNIMADIIAYSVMLSLPADGRWRHGLATELFETHFRHQLDGIHLLLSYYERTRRDIFLSKAEQAVQYLLGMGEELPGGNIWFLHDTLEKNLADCRLFYKNLVISNDFGKSVSNTLCLNTHIWTLTVLHRLKRLFPEQAEYEDFFDRGLKTLREVMQSKKGGFAYYPVYLVRDILVKWAGRTKGRMAKKVLVRYEKFLKRMVLPFLRKFFPRVYMSNGFIERDLTITHLSNIYHLITLKDFLVLYGQTRAGWLLEIVRKSMHYTFRRGFADYYIRNQRTAPMLWTILLLYSEIVDDEYLSYKEHLEKKGVSLSIGAEAYPYL